MDPQNGELNPRQAEILRTLDPGGERPIYDSSLATDLRKLMESALERLGGVLSLDDPLWINKGELTNLLACEGLARANWETPFEWTTKNVVGQVAHRAIERGSIRSDSERTPMDWVDVAIESLQSESRGPGAFLADLTPDQLDSIRITAADNVTKFFADWPPIRRSWAPRLNSAIRVELLGGLIVLSGRPDLILGQATGTSVKSARSAIFDLKTGASARSHQLEADFYALLETFARLVPPFQVGIYYTDTGELNAWKVSEEQLRSTARRVAAWTHSICELRIEKRQAVLQPGPHCRWCPARENCPDGQVWIAARSVEVALTTLGGRDG